MEDKPRNAFSSIAPLEHQYYCRVWELVKSGHLEKLEGRMKTLGQLMLEHPEYQYFWEIPYSFAETELQEAFEQVVANKGEGVNPDLHLTIEAIILEQVDNRDPPETAKAYEALLRAGVKPHEARHSVGRVFSEVVWEISQMAGEKQRPDENLYIRKLRRLSKHPLKVLSEQRKALIKNEKQNARKDVGDMTLPSDEEWEAALRESEKAFREALAMPNKTIVEVLVQGTKLVNAIGAKAIFLMSGLTEPKRGVMYEDELEARAAIKTFKEACNNVFSRFDEILQFFDKQRG